MSVLAFQSHNHPQQVRKMGGPNDMVDDRGTRPEIFDPLHAEFGFTLDVAAAAHNAKVPRFFDRAADGLSLPWRSERVWCNPPFSDLKTWAHKAYTETQLGGCPIVVMLLPNNRCEQVWWQDIIEPRRDRVGTGITVRFLKGRPRFRIPANVVVPHKGDRPPFGLCVVVFEPSKLPLDIFGDLV